MSEIEQFRNKRVTIRFTQDEYNRLHAAFTKTTGKHLNVYLRSILLNKPVTVRSRNASLDDIMPVLILLKDELNAIGNNFNQLIKRLHSLQQVDDIKTWLVLNEKTKQILLQKVTEIKLKIGQIDDHWLR